MGLSATQEIFCDNYFKTRRANAQMTHIQVQNYDKKKS